MATKKVSKTTKQPSGLTVSRDAMVFTCAWKIIDEDYAAGQNFQYQTNLHKSDQWVKASLTPGDTSNAVTLYAASYYPTTDKRLTRFSFRVQGKREKTTSTSGSTTTITTYAVSAWVHKSLTLSVPNKPVLTATLDDALSNVCEFAWETEVADNDQQPFADVEWESIFTKSVEVSDGSKLTWSGSTYQTGTGAASGSISFTENTAQLADRPWVRWVRIRSRGAAGVSGWVYASHVYAMPHKAEITNVSSYAAGTGLSVYVKWTGDSSFGRPIDSSIVQYVITVPAAGLTCPANADWQDMVTIEDTSGKDAVRVGIADTPEADQCLFVRVIQVHDFNRSYSDAVLVRKGIMSAPSGLSVSQNQSTYRATITVTNNSAIPDSRLAIVYRKASNASKDMVVGVMEHGATSITVQCPNWSSETGISFGVYAFVGSAPRQTWTGGVYNYSINAKMSSETIWQGGTVPVAPDNVAAEISGRSGEVIVTWDWSWRDASAAEVSWSTDSEAWESTRAPETFTLDNSQSGKLRVVELELGHVWYFRVRLATVNEEGEYTYGPYSDPVSADVSSAPVKPSLMLSSGVVVKGDTIEASWTYETTDGTPQSYAEIRLATVEGTTVTPGKRVTKVLSGQHVTINPKSKKWETGETYYLIVRSQSASGYMSEYSDPVPVTYAAPLTCAITATSLQEGTYGGRNIRALTAMPLTVTVTGAGSGGTTTVAVERRGDYKIDRPDGNENIGFDGETVAIVSRKGEGQLTITRDDLLGPLDDGAKYRIIATVSDGLGQSDEKQLNFEVFWSHQAKMPRNAAVSVDHDNLAVAITPAAPSGIGTGDTFDLYRLSVDGAELILSGGTFATKYVDPYPAFGPSGGHRIVFRTVNGDYVTADGHIAWLDLHEEQGDILESASSVIDFDGGRVILSHNMAVSSSWKKDFKETSYLGGSVQGDWNPAVHRTGTLSGVVVTDNAETISSMRQLAAYAGICHVRTVEGSSYAADVQVSEKRSYQEAGKLATFDLKITKVDPEGFDGMLYADWLKEITEG